MRGIFKLLLVLALTGAIAYYQETRGPHDYEASPKLRTLPQASTASARLSWGNPASLPDHFARHGTDFGAQSPEEYAQMAAQFLRRAKMEGLPAKVDGNGVLRVYDDRTGSFASYNPDGTTKTFFKPGRRDYFIRQPGQPVNLRTGP